MTDAEIEERMTAREIAQALGLRAAEDRRVVLEKNQQVVMRVANEAMKGDDTARAYLVEFLPTVLRLSTWCPFEDIRIACASLLADLRALGDAIPIPRPRPMAMQASSFFVITNTLEDERGYELLVDTFVHDGRASHLIHMVAMHPEYLGVFLRLHQFLLKGDGPLPFAWRNYINVMAAAEMGCEYLVMVQSDLFLANGGDRAWLEGLDKAPKKLQNLAYLNTIMAHQPWRLTTEHVSCLLKGEDGFSLSQLMQAIVLMAHFHALSAICCAVGVTPEVDLDGGHSWENGRDEDTVESLAATVSGESAHGADDDAWLQKLTETMHVLGTTTLDTDDNVVQFEELEQLEAGETEEPPEQNSRSHRFTVLRIDPEAAWTHHVDFNVRSKEYGVLRSQDYSWADHAFSLLEDKYRYAGDLLDEQFRVIQDLTQNTFGPLVNTETGPFRMAIWQYVQRIKGIQNDDYAYSQVNTLLNLATKKLIKLSVCTPARIGPADWRDFPSGLADSEKIHISLLAAAAVEQAELLYAMRALTRHLT